MSSLPLRVWCNMVLTDDATAELCAAVAGHELLMARRPSPSSLVPGTADESARDADVAFGNPDPTDLIESRRLRWAHINAAGYTRYDRDDLRAALRARGAVMTNSS